MSPRDMNAIVSAELKHIPRGIEPQNALRLLYSSYRKSSLKKNAKVALSKEDVLRWAITDTRALPVSKDYPGWVPEYDPDFFSHSV
jgi:hypothetical protein